MNEHPLRVIEKSDPLLFAKIGDAKELAFADGEISKKHKLLIALAIDMAKQSESGIRSLAGQALANGATKKEITETLRIANYICGVGNMYTAAAALKDII